MSHMINDGAVVMITAEGHKWSTSIGLTPGMVKFETPFGVKDLFAFDEELQNEDGDISQDNLNEQLKPFGYQVEFYTPESQ